MTDLNAAIREIVREELSSFTTIEEPEMVSTDEAAAFLKCGKQVVLELHHERHNNDFPSVQLGPRTIVVDKTRLKSWCARGGV